MSVSRGAKRILLVLLFACRELSAGSFLSIPGVRSQIVEGEKRGQRLGQEGPGAQGLFILLEGQPRGLRPEAPHAAASVLWRCPAGTGLLAPIDFLRLHSSFEDSLREPGVSGAGPTSACLLFATYQCSCILHPSQVFRETLFCISKCSVS